MNTTATRRKPISILEALAMRTVSLIRNTFRVDSNAERCQKLIDRLAKRNIIITDQHAFASLMEDSSRNLAEMLKESGTEDDSIVFITDTLPLPEHFTNTVQSHRLAATAPKELSKVS